MKISTDLISERIYTELRMDILTGKISGGTRLAESTLAKEKGVSRTPAREALHQLVKEDLLYAIPRAGYVVHQLSENDVMDLIETRKSIELVAVQTAFGKITDEELVLLKNNLVNTRAAIDIESMEKMINLDIEFHDIIYKATRSKYLYRICMMVGDYTLKFRQSVIIIPKVAKRAERDHSLIYNSFKARDLEKIKTAVTAHLEIVETDILGYLETIRQNSFFENRL